MVIAMSSAKSPTSTTHAHQRTSNAQQHQESSTSRSEPNRVQNIKRQFEATKRSPPAHDVDDDIPRRVFNSSVYTEVNKNRRGIKNSASSGIKRSPAFRCDKIVRGGCVKSAGHSVVNKVKIFEEHNNENNDQLMVNDTNYLEPYDRRVANDYHRSVENLVEITREKETYRSYEDLTKKPLPPGPPPKKPPRTFTHTPTEANEKSVRIIQNVNSTQSPIYTSENTRQSPSRPLITNVKPSTIKNSGPHSPRNQILKNNNKKINNNNITNSKPLMNNNNKPIVPNVKPAKHNSKPSLQKGHSYAAILKSPPKIQSKSASLNSAKIISGDKSGSPTTTAVGIVNKTNSAIKQQQQQPRTTRPRDPPPRMPPRSKTESHLQYKPPNKPDLSARALLTACIPGMCNAGSSAEYTTLPQRAPKQRTVMEISAPVPIARSFSDEHIYAEPFNKDPSAGIPVMSIVQQTPLLLTRTEKSGLYYMSNPVESAALSPPLWPQRPAHLPLCSSFSTPSLRSMVAHSPVSHHYGRANLSPPPPHRIVCDDGRTSTSPASCSLPQKTLTPADSEPTDRLTKAIPTPPPPPHNINNTRRVFHHTVGQARPLTSPPEKPQRSGAIARLKAKVTAVQRSPSPQHTEIDETRIQVLMNRAFSGLQLSPVGSEETGSSDSGADSGSQLDSPLEGGFVLVPVASPPQPKRLISSPPSSPSEEDECSEEETRRLVERRKGYIRRTSSIAFHTNSQRRMLLRKNAIRHPPRLFHALLLVGLRYDAEKKHHIPYIKDKYPENAEIPNGMEAFVFPDSESWPPVTPVEEHRSYSLVLTDENGERLFGFCRRVVPEGAAVCIPLAYCVLSQHRASGFYHKVLKEVEALHGQPEVERLTFLSQLYASHFPSPGQSLMMPRFLIHRPPDPRLEEKELALTFECLQHGLLVKLLASLLHERKVLLLSESLWKLTSCIAALQSALYPFSWQHTLISALPPSLVELCEAPFPVLIGILKTPGIRQPICTVDEGMVVDLDQGRVLHCMEDEDKILPGRLRKALRLALQLSENSTKPNEAARNVLISEAFVRMFVEVCGHYRTHIVTQQDGKRVFEKDSFVKGVSPKCMQTFLEWFTETAMFAHFRDSRLQSTTQGIFERRCCEKMQEMEKSTLLFLKNSRVINGKGKTIGDRFKGWANAFVE